MRSARFTEAEFEALGVVKNHIDVSASWGGCMFETHGAEADFVKAEALKDHKRVWTVMDGEDGEVLVVNGCHFVNRIGYLITEKPGCDGDEFVA